MKLIDILSTAIPKWMGTTTSIIVHTLLFGGIFLLRYTGMGVDQIMLVLTTVVSLEAIYLSLFIQMTVNRQGQSLENVEEDIDEIQKDVEGIEDDVEDITEDIGEIQKDDEEEEKEDNEMMLKMKSLDKIGTDLERLMQDVKSLRKTIDISKQKNVE